MCRSSPSWFRSHPTPSVTSTSLGVHGPREARDQLFDQPRTEHVAYTCGCGTALNIKTHSIIMRVSLTKEDAPSQLRLTKARLVDGRPTSQLMTDSNWSTLSSKTYRVPNSFRQRVENCTCVGGCGVERTRRRARVTKGRSFETCAELRV